MQSQYANVHQMHQTSETCLSLYYFTSASMNRQKAFHCLYRGEDRRASLWSSPLCASVIEGNCKIVTADYARTTKVCEYSVNFSFLWTLGWSVYILLGNLQGMSVDRMISGAERNYKNKHGWRAEGIPVENSNV